MGLLSSIMVSPFSGINFVYVSDILSPLMVFKQTLILSLLQLALLIGIRAIISFDFLHP